MSLRYPAFPRRFVFGIVLFWCALGAAARPSTVMDRIPLVPAPRELAYHGEMFPFPDAVSVKGLDLGDPAQARTVETLRLLFEGLRGVRTDFGGQGSFVIEFRRAESGIAPEGYTLESKPTGILIQFATETGRFYAAQTLYQLLRYADAGTQSVPFGLTVAEPHADERRFVPVLSIRDEPAYRERAVMVDLGRAPYSLALLKRVVRIMAHLKLNLLHVHLLDDQLCGFRFATLPLGHENPFALDAADLRELVRFARSYHVSVMPEVESWGHVQSIVYHYPELYGAEGVYRGASFAVGERTYALLEKIYDEIVPCLEDDAAFHVGLDEAKWVVAAGEENRGATPTAMVGRIHEILMRVAAKHGKRITMHLWADHGGRPLPADLEGKVVIEPWKYKESDGPEIVKALQQYGGAGKTPVMMGAGASSMAYSGAYGATGVWCREGLKYSNILGVTLCLWESNDINGRLPTLYCGADYAWSPATPKALRGDTMGEELRYQKTREMRFWQTIFPVADPAAIDADRGPEVQTGRYVWPPNAGRPVAPTMDFVPPVRAAEPVSAAR